MSIYEQIQGELRRGRTADQIVDALVGKGLSEVSARRFVDRAGGPSGARPSAAPDPATAGPAAPGSFTVGGVLGSSLGIWIANLVPFLALTLICHLPLVLYTVAFVSEGKFSYASVENFEFVQSVVGLVLGLITSGALAYGVVQQIYGGRASVGRCIAAGVQRLLPMIGVGLLAGVYVAGPLIVVRLLPLMLPLGALETVGRFPLTAALALAVVLGVVATCRLWVAVPVAVVEEPGVGASLDRSIALTSGRRLRVFAIVLVLGLFGYGAQKALEVALLRHATSLADAQTFFYAQLAATLLINTLGSTAQAVGYCRLTLEQDGVDAAGVAKTLE